MPEGTAPDPLAGVSEEKRAAIEKKREARRRRGLSDEDIVTRSPEAPATRMMKQSDPVDGDVNDHYDAD